MKANGSGSRIRVFDADGHQIGETYPKRARGLVKHGRAVWLTESSYAQDPDAECPDLLIFPRDEAGETDIQSFITQREDTSMSEYNNEHEQRIHDMIAQFRTEMAKAREIAEKAAAEAENVIREVEASGIVEKAAEKAGEVAQTVKAAFAEEAEKASEAAKDLGDAVNEAAGESAKAADAAFESAKRAFEEAQADFEEAKRAYKEAEAAKKANEEEAHGAILDEELCRQAKENLNEIRREAKDAVTTAWEELKKGWAELKDASSGSFAWLKDETKTARENLKEAFREMKENLKSMMDDLGDAGDGTTGEDGSTRSADEAAWAWEDADEDEDTADRTERVRANIEAEMNDVQERVTEMLRLVKQEYSEGNIGFDKYMEYTDKYTAYLHERLVELRGELKKL